MAIRIIDVQVIDSKAIPSSRDAGAEGSYNSVMLRFSFNSAWDGLTKKVTMVDSVGRLSIDIDLDASATCLIPAEPLSKAGKMSFSVTGLLYHEAGNYEECIRTAGEYLTVSASVPEANTVVSPVTPDEGAQLQQQIDLFNQLLNSRIDAQEYNLTTDLLTQQAALFATGTGARADGVVYSNPVTFRDITNLVVKRFLGQTLVNLLTNGNFASTSNWTSFASTSTAASNTLTNTGNGSASNPQIYQALNIPTGPSKRYFLRALARVTNANCTSLRLYTYTVTLGTRLAQEIINPVANQWYTLYGIPVQSTSDTTVRFVVAHHYADGTTANGKVMEAKEAFMIDMGNDTANPLYNKTAAEMHALAPVWFNGTVNVVNPTVRSRNSNGTLSTSIVITETLRSNGTTRDEITLVNNIWTLTQKIDESGNILAEPITRAANLTGQLTAYKGGTIQALSSTIPLVMDYKVVEDYGAWQAYIPTLTWTTATPGGTVNSNFKYRIQGSTVTIQGNYNATNGNGATQLTVSLPFAAKAYGGNQPAAGSAQQKVNTAWSALMAYIDDAANLLKFRSFPTATGNQAVEVDFVVSYEMA